MENWNDYRKCVRITKLAWKNARGFKLTKVALKSSSAAIIERPNSHFEISF